MKAILGFVAGFIVAIGFSGRAVEMFTEGGQCRFSDKDGAFFSHDLPAHNYMHPACLSLGLADKWTDGRWGWRAAYLTTGSIQARDNLARNDGMEFITHPCDPVHTGEDGCFARFNGSGYTNGVSLGLTYEQQATARIALTGEFGLFFFQHHFKAEAQFIDKEWGPQGGRKISYNETSPMWALPDPLAGLSLSYKLTERYKVYAAGRHYWALGHRALSLTNHAFNQFTVGLGVKL